MAEAVERLGQAVRDGWGPGYDASVVRGLSKSTLDGYPGALAKLRRRERMHPGCDRRRVLEDELGDIAAQDVGGGQHQKAALRGATTREAGMDPVPALALVPEVRSSPAPWPRAPSAVHHALGGGGSRRQWRRYTTRRHRDGSSSEGDPSPCLSTGPAQRRRGCSLGRRWGCGQARSGVSSRSPMSDLLGQS